eukprot:9496299-Pyramimonas_sp.AAC.1
MSHPGFRRVGFVDRASTTPRRGAFRGGLEPGEPRGDGPVAQPVRAAQPGVHAEPILHVPAVPRPLPRPRGGAGRDSLEARADQRDRDLRGRDGPTLGVAPAAAPGAVRARARVDGRGARVDVRGARVD